MAALRQSSPNCVRLLEAALRLILSALCLVFEYQNAPTQLDGVLGEFHCVSWCRSDSAHAGAWLFAATWWGGWGSKCQKTKPDKARSLASLHRWEM